ncbi:ABC transporter permease [Alphaproteobacteria bacterium]|nr:ABC transporter permease [Alphaproteobacteria bacterium]
MRLAARLRLGVSGWVLAALAVLAVCAPLLANDRPLLVWHQGRPWFPMAVDYAETWFTGPQGLPSVADFRDPAVMSAIRDGGGWVIGAPIRFSYDTINYDLAAASPAPPSRANWLGTDDMGRDVAARLLYGLRLSLAFGLLLTGLSAALGIAAGAAQGYFGGWLDLAGQRILEVWSGMPQLFILIIVAGVVEPSFWSLLLVMLLFSWTSLVGVVRAEFLKVRQAEYVMAARALGVGRLAIMTRHILPNACVAAGAYLPFLLCSSIVSLTALDYLGLGLPSGSASLGDVIRQGKENLHAPWLGLSAFALMTVLLTCLVFAGDAARKALDPRGRRS